MNIKLCRQSEKEIEPTTCHRQRHKPRTCSEENPKATTKKCTKSNGASSHEGADVMFMVKAQQRPDKQSKKTAVAIGVIGKYGDAWNARI